MQSDLDLLQSLWEYLLDQHPAGQYRLQLPIPGMASVDELRRAITEGERRRFLTDVDECLAGVFLISLTDDGLEALGTVPE